MKLSIKFLFATALFLFIGLSTTTAQRLGPRGGQADPEKMAERQTTMLTEKLELSEEQAEKVKAINLNYTKKREEARKEAATQNREAMKTSRETMNKEKNEELKQVLTEEQFQKYETLMAEFQNRPKGRSGKDGKGGKNREKKS